MAIDVLIQQKLFTNKTLPLEVILGDRLRYGNFVNDQLNEGELGETEFVAYDPENIGRGFSVVWNPQERKRVMLRLPQPSTTQELKAFYAVVERIVNHWGGKLTVDGNRVRLADFLAALEAMDAFNNKIIEQFSKSVLDGEHETLTLYSAMCPLVIGKEEAAAFLGDPLNYAKWLHEKQSADAYWAVPDFFAGDDGIFARYILINGVPSVFPCRPAVPFGAVDPATGEPLVCEKWLVWFVVEGEQEPVAEMEYAEFLSILPEEKKSRFDANHFLLAEMSEEEIKTLSAQV